MKKLFLYFIFFYLFFNIEGNAKLDCLTWLGILQTQETKRIETMCREKLKNLEVSEYLKCHKKWTTKPHEKYDKAVREGTCERTQINYTTTTNTSETEKLEQRISDQENEIQMLKNRINELEEKLNQ